MVSFMFRAGLALVLTCAVFFETAVAADIVILQTNDGDTFRGELVRETQEQVVITVEGIEAVFEQKNVYSVIREETPRQIFDRTREALDSGDLGGRLELVRKMIGLDELGLAKLEVVALERDFPENAVVQKERSILTAKERLAQTRASTASARRDGDGERPKTRSRSDRRGETDDNPYLSREQLRLIRVYEVDLDTEPRIRIDEDTLNSFLQKYSTNRLVPAGRRQRTDFKRLDGYEQLDLFFRVQARDLYDQIDVREEPPPLSSFRRTVNPRYVARYFAPTFGHGQIDGLLLFNQRPEYEAEAYTNFFRLTQFEYDGRPMIDRINPELSLLLQWGLDRDAARFPAPDLEGWQPNFRSIDDPEFRRYVDWIDSLLKADFDYGIELIDAELAPEYAQ